MIFNAKTLIVFFVLVCHNGIDARLPTKGQSKRMEERRRLHVGPHAPLVVSEEPSMAPSSLGNSSNAVESDNTKQSNSGDGERTDSGVEPPSMAPVDMSSAPTSRSSSETKQSSTSVKKSSKVYGDPSPAPGVPAVAPTTVPTIIVPVSSTVNLISLPIIDEPTRATVPTPTVGGKGKKKSQ